jgi:hypothetical protein
MATLNIIVAMFYVAPDFRMPDDTVTYVDAISYLKGEAMSGGIPYSRLLTTPLMLFSTQAVDFFSDNIYLSLAVINLIFYALAVPVFYETVMEIYGDSKTAFFASALLFSNYYIMNIGNAFLADMAGRFFLLLTNFFAVKYFIGREEKYFYLAILSSAVGVLFKEFGALGFISLVCLVALLRIDLKTKIKKIISALILFSVIPALYHLWFYFHFHYSYFDWYSYAATMYSPAQHAYGIAVFIKVMGWLFLAGWPIFLWGLWKEYKDRDREKEIILTGLLPASLAFFAWPMFMQRTAFVLVPWLSMVAGRGLSKIRSEYLALAFLFMYMFVNYNIERLLPVINLPI